MTLEQQALLLRSLTLIILMMGSGAVSAFVFRKIYSWAFLIGSFFVSIFLIFATSWAAQTGSAGMVYITCLLFGASVGSTLGGFFSALAQSFGMDDETALRAIGLTLGSGFLATITAALIGILSGFNFQSLGPILFMGLILLIGLGFARLFGWLSNKAEWYIGIGASVFWVIYMVFDFNKVVDLYTENTWPAAVDIAMNIYLDFINFIIRVAPYIFDAID